MDRLLSRSTSIGSWPTSGKMRSSREKTASIAFVCTTRVGTVTEAALLSDIPGANDPREAAKRPPSWDRR